MSTCQPVNDLFFFSFFFFFFFPAEIWSFFVVGYLGLKEFQIPDKKQKNFVKGSMGARDITRVQNLRISL